MSWAAALGYAGAGVALGSYAARSHRTLCFLVAAGMALMSVHYWMLGAVTPALLCLFSAVRSYAAPAVSIREPTQRACLTLLALGVVGVLGAASWQAWHSSLAILGTAMLVVVSFNLSDRPFRWSLLLVELFFAANALAVGSMPGVVLAVAGMALNLYTLLRSKVKAA